MVDKVIVVKVDIHYFNEALNCTVRKGFDGDVKFAIVPMQCGLVLPYYFCGGGFCY